ncbi:DUF4468 domain-containing protein [Pedobacter changchengzhani]|uniref:DUF4468 domain-containing protein n=1 Tax=Pedobacter changchengzhani TaxID=2529274 RepID=A0A4R5MM73_9SPHI|nr:DUF4468 domain-containing protein [Pedobacter changchengzhani]TDG36821.1 DUF4468 domain-containing protein [Pedobacter changchengzhani]
MKYFAVLFLFFFSLKLCAQQKQFSLNEDGKYVFYEVVDVKTISKDILMARAKVFINKLDKEVVKNHVLTDTSIFAKGKFVIDKTVLIAGHPSGEVSYNLTFEARNGKYRFWLTDFEYIPYQRNRYGNYVATTKIGTPLEKSTSKLNMGEWKANVSAAYNKVEKLSADFKEFLSRNPIVNPLENNKTKVNDKW